MKVGQKPIHMYGIKKTAELSAAGKGSMRTSAQIVDLFRNESGKVIFPSLKGGQLLTLFQVGGDVDKMNSGEGYGDYVHEAAGAIVDAIIRADCPEITDTNSPEWTKEVNRLYPVYGFLKDGTMSGHGLAVIEELLNEL